MIHDTLLIEEAFNTLKSTFEKSSSHFIVTHSIGSISRMWNLQYSTPACTCQATDPVKHCVGRLK